MVCGCYKGLPQDQDYHDFANDKTIYGIQNAHDVLSNIPFLVFGLWGLVEATDYRWQIFFLGCILTCFGSSYYHWAPDNKTLVWDRLPMTISFMSFFAVILEEQTQTQTKATNGIELVIALLFLGVASVLYWAMFDDLIPYVLVQFGPMVAFPILLFLRENPNQLVYLAALGWYLVAKGCELMDRRIYGWTGERVSGHTLKHLTASLGMYVLIGL